MLKPEFLFFIFIFSFIRASAHQRGGGIEVEGEADSPLSENP